MKVRGPPISLPSPDMQKPPWKGTEEEAKYLETVFYLNNDHVKSKGTTYITVSDDIYWSEIIFSCCLVDWGSGGQAFLTKK